MQIKSDKILTSKLLFCLKFYQFIEYFKIINDFLDINLSFLVDDMI
jgi:hypothetical protein